MPSAAVIFGAYKVKMGFAARDAGTAVYSHEAALSLSKKRNSTRLERTSLSHARMTLGCRFLMGSVGIYAVTAVACPSAFVVPFLVTKVSVQAQLMQLSVVEDHHAC